jgi:voltage-gated potassium channel
MPEGTEMNKSVKRRTHEILEVATEGDVRSRIFDAFLIALILFNVLSVMIESMQGIANPYKDHLRVFEVFSVWAFTIEYGLRLWVCTEVPQFKPPILGRLRYALTPLALIDLVAFLPFFLPMIIPLDLRFARMFRLLRLFRIFKLVRYTASLRLLGGVLKSKKEELVITLFVGVILLVFGSSFMYLVENPVQPDVFSSIPAALWWGVITMTTVGYGDLYPITALGKMIGAGMAVLGIGMFALPAGILGSGLVEWIHKKNEGSQQCPHCGKALPM